MVLAALTTPCLTFLALAPGCQSRGRAPSQVAPVLRSECPIEVQSTTSSGDTVATDGVFAVISGFLSASASVRLVCIAASNPTVQLLQVPVVLQSFNVIDQFALDAAVTVGSASESV